MMKWIKIVIVSSCLMGINGPISTSWGQTKAPVPGTVSFEGTVLDAQTEQPISGVVVTAKSQSGTMRAQNAVTTNGTFQLILDPKQPYLISFKATGYEPYDEPQTFTSYTTTLLRKRPTKLYRIGTKPASPPAAAPTTTAATSATTSASPLPTGSATPTAAAGQPVAGSSRPETTPRVTPPKTLDAKVVYTPPLVVAPTGKTTQLRAIQFVQSKAELLPDAQPALEQLLDYLTTHPTAEIELSGHTDNQGNFDENVRLSKQRVDLVKEQLVKGGIAASRITTRGFGPTRPVASNNSEATRQLNRRVEMVVMKQ